MLPKQTFVSLSFGGFVTGIRKKERLSTAYFFPANDRGSRDLTFPAFAVRRFYSRRTFFPKLKEGGAGSTWIY